MRLVSAVSGSKCELDKLAMCYVFAATSADVPLSKSQLKEKRGTFEFEKWLHWEYAGTAFQMCTLKTNSLDLLPLFKGALCNFLWACKQTKRQSSDF